jgi:hypothetical protein
MPEGQQRRFVRRGRHHQTHDSQLFSALVTCNDGGSLRLEPGHALVTVVLVGGEPREYFEVGDRFALWFGGDVGSGVVTAGCSSESRGQSSRVERAAGD